MVNLLFLGTFAIASLMMVSVDIPEDKIANATITNSTINLTAAGTNYDRNLKIAVTTTFIVGAIQV